MIGMLTQAYGVPIIVQPHWPMVFSHIEMVKSPSHPLIYWLARYIPFDPDSYYPKKVYRDRDPIYFQGKIICSPQQFELLKQETAKFQVM